jgi:hypothetical protein
MLRPARVSISLLGRFLIRGRLAFHRACGGGIFGFLSL